MSGSIASLEEVDRQCFGSGGSWKSGNVTFRAIQSISHFTLFKKIFSVVFLYTATNLREPQPNKSIFSILHISGAEHPY